ncbi:MAG: antibiotic biosynthesis monooxygenase family protein [Candidatus Binatia bacterium]
MSNSVGVASYSASTRTSEPLTPEPPYYAVIAPAELSSDIEGYAETAAELFAIAPTQPGFLGIETCVERGFSMAVSYWSSLEAIAAWRHRAEHLAAKGMARRKWFDRYVTRIARVERVY